MDISCLRIAERVRIRQDFASVKSCLFLWCKMKCAFPDINLHILR